MLHPDHWRHGVMGEALQAVVQCGFQRLGFHSIEAMTDARNEASNGLLRKQGFTQEALFREDFYWDGQFLDTAVWSKLAPSINLRHGSCVLSSRNQTRNMKHVMTTLALVAGLLASPMLRAQDADMDDNGKKSPEERAKHRTEQMTKQLGLNDVQIAKVNTVNMNFMRAMADVKMVKDEASRKTRGQMLKDKREAD